MDLSSATGAFAALAQPTRLRAFRQLIKAYPEELPAGDIAQFCKVPHNTMSTHLSILTRAGLLAVRRDGRSMNYSLNIGGFQRLVTFLMRDCCGGRAELCAPIVQELSCCLPAKIKETSRARARL
jgi:ArsR family transcriptional regulator